VLFHLRFAFFVAMSLVVRMIRYLRDVAEYEARVDEFMKQYRHLFQGSQGLAQEQSHEFYAVFKAYEALVDGILADFCAAEGFSSGSDLLVALHVELKGKPLSNLRGGYIKSLLTDGTYEGFLKVMLDYAGASPTPGGESKPVGGAAWSAEEAAALSSVGALPPLPSVGEAAFGFYPDEQGGGQWLACVVAQLPEDGSGVVVTWQHNGVSNLMPAGHVQKAA